MYQKSNRRIDFSLSIEEKRKNTSNAFANACEPSISRRFCPEMNCFKANRFPPAAILFLSHAINASANN